LHKKQSQLEDELINFNTHKETFETANQQLHNADTEQTNLIQERDFYQKSYTD